MSRPNLSSPVRGAAHFLRAQPGLASLLPWDGGILRSRCSGYAQLSALTLALVFSLLLLLTGCADGEGAFGCEEGESDCVACERSSDCDGGEVCRRGRCVAAESESSEEIGVRLTSSEGSRTSPGTAEPTESGGVRPPGETRSDLPSLSGLPGSTPTGAPDCRELGCPTDEVCNRRTGVCVPVSQAPSSQPSGSSSCGVTHDPNWEANATCGDGIADEGCPCEFGTVQSCFMGPPTARGVGTCRDGVQVCVDRQNPRWGACEGYIPPRAEACDGRDLSCNGCVDDVSGEVCDADFICPDHGEIAVARSTILEAADLFPGVEIEGMSWELQPPEMSTRARMEAPEEFTATFFADVAGDYRVRALLELEGGDARSCDWILRASGPGLRLELIWDTQGEVDLDLHLQRNDGLDRPWCDNRPAGDCYWLNCQHTVGTGAAVDWGYPRSDLGSFCGPSWDRACTNPRLDVETLSTGVGAEQLNLDNPNDGDRFRVRVQHYLGPGVTNPTLNIWCGGELSSVLGLAPDGVGLQRRGETGAGCSSNPGWIAADVAFEVNEQTGATTCDVSPTLVNGDWDVRIGTEF